MKQTLSAITIALMVMGCESKEGADVTLLYQSNQCHTQSAEMRQLGSIDEVLALFSTGMSLTPPAIPSDIDLSSHALVLLAMGQKPSAGYGISIDVEQVKVNDAELWLPVSFDTPAGDMAAAVITSPCVLFSVGKSGISRIVAGNTGLSIDVK